MKPLTVTLGILLAIGSASFAAQTGSQTTTGPSQPGTHVKSGAPSTRHDTATHKTSQTGRPASNPPVSKQ